MADEPVTLEQVKDHLRLSPSMTAQDNHLKLLISAARRSIERDIGKSIYATHPDVDASDLPVIREAVLLMVGHWYWNREAVTATTVKELPLGIEHLLWPFKSLRV